MFLIDGPKIEQLVPEGEAAWEGEVVAWEWGPDDEDDGVPAHRVLALVRHRLDQFNLAGVEQLYKMGLMYILGIRAWGGNYCVASG